MQKNPKKYKRYASFQDLMDEVLEDVYWPPNVRLEIYHLGVSIFMTKYDFELKKKVVMAYFNGEGGKYVLAKKYGITSPCNVLKWINNFKKFGDQGLIHPENLI